MPSPFCIFVLCDNENRPLVANIYWYYNNKRIKQKLAGMSPVQYRIHSNQLAA
ncbi:IS3 family transposase [Shimazuella soli]|uniref:IS3 family transposase n=1 Tax=Shimazuella soli TaxID=1892854 RepID=UPI003B83234B